MTGTRVKICGLTRPQDVEVAVEAGADLLGFVFDRGPCEVSLEQAEALLSIARGRGTARGADVCCVAVIGDLPPARRSAVAALGFDAMQMEASAYVASEDQRPWALPAFFDDGRLEARVSEFRRAHAPRFSSLSTDAPEHPGGDALGLGRGLRGLVNVDGRGGGGTGTRTDWRAAALLARRGPLMLAGGLTPDNVRQAILEVSPLAVDVSSGVEAAPGKKDPARVRAFIAAAKGYPSK